MKYPSDQIHTELTQLTKNKVVQKVMQVSADEGFTIYFTDGTTLHVFYSGCEGEVYFNETQIECSGDYRT